MTGRSRLICAAICLACATHTRWLLPLSTRRLAGLTSRAHAPPQRNLLLLPMTPLLNGPLPLLPLALHPSAVNEGSFLFLVFHKHTVFHRLCSPNPSWPSGYRHSFILTHLYVFHWPHSPNPLFISFPRRILLHSFCVSVYLTISYLNVNVFPAFRTHCCFLLLSNWAATRLSPRGRAMFLKFNYYFVQLQMNLRHATRLGRIAFLHSFVR